MFTKYPSVENDYRTKYIEQIRAEGLHRQPYVVTEKVHGKNLSLVTDGKTVSVAKRSGILSIDEISKFYRADIALDRYKEAAITVFDVASCEYADVL